MAETSRAEARKIIEEIRRDSGLFTAAKREETADDVLAVVDSLRADKARIANM